MIVSSDNQKRIRNERTLIFEMIDASCELAAKKGPHKLEPACSCMSCVTRRKERLRAPLKDGPYHL